MGYLKFKSEYDRFPETKVEGFKSCAESGFDSVIDKISEKLNKIEQKKKVLCVDCYPGVNDNLFENLKEKLSFDLVINADDLFFDGKTLDNMMKPFLTDDRVRGIMYYGTLTDFIDEEKLKSAIAKVSECESSVLIYGFGASLVSKGDLLVYADMARWEIQIRYRKGMPNFKQTNYDEEALRKNKRGFFVEWRIADRHKRNLYNDIDLYIDANEIDTPKIVEMEALLAGLKQLTQKPFRLVPYFDPGVWGGQWMKEVCNLDPDKVNYAWSFDGVPEENSLYLNFDGIRIETPAMNLVQYLPRDFIGEKNFSRFGAEYPIRFDFLDTFEGQNLSLQVHPTTEYIKSKFGMTYTQDESYYILDCQKDGGVYLGVKENINSEDMIADLKKAEKGEIKFPDEKYINRFPAKKHDHFLIPAGTIHCSSKDCLVLEISATPYIFTFKLWDWDRVDLNGMPRPIHVSDGEKVIQYNRNTQWVKDNLINKFETLEDNENYKEVKTGLHELEFIETHRLEIKTEAIIKSDGEFSQLNLVEGRAAIIESPSGKFDPYVVHYAETFIIPAKAGDCLIKPYYEGEEIKVLKANVRF